MQTETQHQHIHLDIVGGIAGDMFVAALVNAFPDKAAELLNVLSKLEIENVTFEIKESASNHIAGLQFSVHEVRDSKNQINSYTTKHHHEHHHHEHHHIHRSWAEIRSWINALDLSGAVKSCALTMFSMLAEVEGKIHSVKTDDVRFHEVGAWDSIVDFIAAAWLIDQLKIKRWTWSAIPLGGGKIRSSHGLLPVPAPATALLLEGFSFHDDGVGGERVTPTGAAILRYLKMSTLPKTSGPTKECLYKTGIGIGTKNFSDVPNILRCLVFSDDKNSNNLDVDQILCIRFEVDDQSPEDLACGLDHIRGNSSVYEVFQFPIYGKKNRITIRVEILAEIAAKDELINQCFIETTTLGLRWSIVERAKLHRYEQSSTPGNERVKHAYRPDHSVSHKVEMDDVSLIAGFVNRNLRRNEILTGLKDQKTRKNK